MIEIFTSRWQNKDLAELECVPVGVSRGVPRWKTPYRYKLARELAPTREAFAIEDWGDFAASYRAGLEELGIDLILSKLTRISAEAGWIPIVLVCFEADPVDCHRGLLASYLRERAGIVVSELAPGSLPGRLDPPEPRLF